MWQNSKIIEQKKLIERIFFFFLVFGLGKNILLYVFKKFLNAIIFWFEYKYIFFEWQNLNF